MKGLALAFVLAPSVARAEPGPWRGSVGIGVGVAEGGMVDTGDCGDPGLRKAVELHAAGGRAGDLQLAAGLGWATFAVPAADCYDDVPSTSGTARELRATIGVGTVRPISPTLRLHARVTLGVAWLHLATHDEAFMEDDEADSWGPAIELGAGASYALGRGWVGAELTLAAAELPTEFSYSYEIEPGSELGAQLVIGVDL